MSLGFPKFEASFVWFCFSKLNTGTFVRFCNILDGVWPGFNSCVCNKVICSEMGLRDCGPQ